ncbi:hypothetical protein PTNB85_10497 [Pyrenophora teres f. teres]|uniref:Uncharacterized protein n=1 Tax=Pyrenophora teres f. teres TaxID=97479 RepID=A0A6S6W1T1_9PLEO|nr:hypothetical protein HRS9139_10459 [Pyrenophora teres f. teres]KAE8822194.1 hypothetical protein PTNB85_10497 [Pyrenophora teres f. teres]KAE8852442.1 hypothetical protein PTNB29_10463 [Pyrenophora teres f. teres]CAE7034486.1 hypothetical protein PTTW11_05455 [Pyrenophora teres f. teres]CAE7192106.1 hypothetical protein PTTW11_07488 [Pyrenophora teres f. teres]
MSTRGRTLWATSDESRQIRKKTISYILTKMPILLTQYQQFRAHIATTYYSRRQDIPLYIKATLIEENLSTPQQVAAGAIFCNPPLELYFNDNIYSPEEKEAYTTEEERMATKIKGLTQRLLELSVCETWDKVMELPFELRAMIYDQVIAGGSCIVADPLYGRGQMINLHDSFCLPNVVDCWVKWTVTRQDLMGEAAEYWHVETVRREQGKVKGSNRASGIV